MDHRPPYMSQSPSRPMHTLNAPLPPQYSSRPSIFHSTFEQQPQTFFNNDIFYPKKEPRNGFLTKEQEKEVKILRLLEHSHGPNPKITQEEYDRAAQHVDRLEREEMMKREQLMMEEQRIQRYHEMRNGKDSSASSSLLPPPPPPPPPPQSSSFPPSLHPPTPLEDPTRTLFPRSSSPRMYGVQNHMSALPPPPPPFANRQMLPPHSPPFTPQVQHRDPSIGSYTNGRELPTPSASSKPSSMSISSLLGGDSSRPRDSRATSINGSSGYNSSISHPLESAVSPTKTEPEPRIDARAQDQPSGWRNTYNSSRPPHAQLGNGRMVATSSINADSPLFTKLSQSSADSGSQISPRSEQGPPQNWRATYERSSDPERFTARPISQPDGMAPSREDINRKNVDANGRIAFGRPDNEGITSRQAIDRLLHQQSRLGRKEPISRISPPHKSPPDARKNSKYPFLSNASKSLEATPNRTIGHDKGYSEPKQNSVQKGPLGPEALRRLRDERLGNVQKEAPEPRPRILQDAVNDRPAPDEIRYPASVIEMERSQSLDRAIQQTRENENGHRNSLALMLENGRGRGRFSPLPQAVQGAQGRTDGPSRDPSIKNEFSKMFAGIGSGVSSSGLAGSGTSTPLGFPSPKQNETEARLSFANRPDLVDTAKSRNVSRGSNKRSRKTKGDEGKDGEGGKGSKRSRHHHHAPGHHHHHHGSHVIGDPGASNHHHHHHPDGTIHYHTHTKPTHSALTPLSQTHSAPPQITTTSADPPPRPPKTTINNTVLLSSVSHLPRHHLGSVLYSPILSSPPSSPSSFSSPSTISNTKLPFPPSSYTIPPHHTSPCKENCTLTIRIPRLYLTPLERRAVCSTRAVWGTGVYTDDSDPLAAAIHSGWIIGDYGDDVNPEMLDPDPPAPKPVQSTTQGETEYTDTAPARPLQPPRGKDAHLTILILPPLARYKGTIRHGIKSRDWGDDHSGASFLVQGLRWLDEGSARGRERGGRARHAYLNGRFIPPRILVGGAGGRVGGLSGLWRGEKGKGKGKEELVVEGEGDDKGEVEGSVVVAGPAPAAA